MDEWGGALEVDGLPSSASIDELSVLLSELANCRQHHILLSSRGASSVGTCLVLLRSADTAAGVADLLDSYPLSGGLLEARTCANPAAWVQRHVMQHLSSLRSSGQPASSRPPAQQLPRAQPPPAQPPAPQPLQPVQPPPPAGGASGLTAYEAEAREAQRMLQELREQNEMGQLFGGGGWGGEQEGGWGGEGEGSTASDSEGEWSQVGGRSGAKSAGRRGGGGGDASSCRIMVRNIALAVHQSTVRSYFQQFGQVQDVIKFPDARYAFVHYLSPDDAAAAIAAVDGQLVPQLNPALPVQAHYREQGGSGGGGGVPGAAALRRGGSASSGGSAAGAAPRRGGSASGGGGGQHPISAAPTGKLFVGHIDGGATLKDLEALFVRFGPVFDLELRRANGEGRVDQWGFVNFRRKQDALAAYEELEGVVVPGFTEVLPSGQRKPLKLQYRSA